MPMTTNVVSGTDTNGFSGISGAQNARNLDISRHAWSQPVRPSMPSSARGSDGGPRRFTEFVLNEQALRNQSQREVTASTSPRTTRGETSRRRAILACGIHAEFDSRIPESLERGNGSFSPLRSISARLLGLTLCPGPTMA